MEHHQKLYKNSDKGADSMRQRRHNVTVSIRKDKREALIAARRNVHSHAALNAKPILENLNPGDTMTPLVKFLEGNPSFEEIEAFAHAFLQLCRQQIEDPLVLSSKEATLDILKSLHLLTGRILSYDLTLSYDGLVDILCALSYITEKTDRVKKAMFIKIGFPEVLFLLFPTTDQNLRLLTLRVIADICSGGFYEVDEFLKVDILSFARSAVVVDAISGTQCQVNYEAVRLLSYVLNGPSEQVQAVINEKIFGVLKDLLMAGNNDVFEVTVIALCNAARMREGVHEMLALDFIPPLCEALERCGMEASTKIIQTFLGILYFADDENQFKQICEKTECLGLQSIENLMNDTDEYLSEMAAELYEKIKGNEAEDDC